MTVAQITPPTPRTDALADHAYCLPVVRELTLPRRRPRWHPHLVTTSQRPGVSTPTYGTRSVSPACRAGSNVAVMEFGILGPLEVRADGRPVALGGARPRAVFAVLALHPNQPMSAERLAVALWGEDVPPSAVKTVQVYVARLRKALDDPDVLVTTPAGYRLRVRPANSTPSA